MDKELLLEPKRVDTYLDTIQYLPTRPTLMLKLVELFGRPDRDLDEIVELVRQDPALTVEVLRHCNSSFFGEHEPVVDFTEAVFKLGFYEVYRKAMAIFAMQNAACAGVNKEMSVELLWQHSIVTALTSGVIARELEESEGVAFTIGILHDIGKVIMASAKGVEYSKLLVEFGSRGKALADAEREVFGFNHTDAGARLLGRWGVPEQILIPVQCHHHEAWAGPFARLSAIVNLANLLTHCIQNETPVKHCGMSEISPAMELLGIGPDKLLELEQLSHLEIKRSGGLLVKQ